MALEWGIARNTKPNVLHRGPMTQEAAYEWIDTLPEGKIREMFVVVNREVGEWGSPTQAPLVTIVDWDDYVEACNDPRVIELNRRGRELLDRKPDIHLP